MSTIKVNKIENTATADGGIAIDASGHVTVDGQQLPTTGALTHRNIVVNGAMNVAQRGTSKTGITASQYATVDRMYVGVLNCGTWTSTRESNAPAGFSNSFKMLCTTADASPAAGDFAVFQYFFEAHDIQHLNYGTSDAVPLTVSFWVKSDKTGNASFACLQPDAADRTFSKQYTINTANTWEYKTIIIPADENGVIDDNNDKGLLIEWWCNSGTDFSSGSHPTTWTAQDDTDRNASNIGIGQAVNDYLQITGIQVEVGEKPTPFEHRGYGDELLRCQRYYQVIDMASNSYSAQYSGNGNFYGAPIYFITEMRSQPSSYTYSNISGANYWVQVAVQAVAGNSTSGITFLQCGTHTTAMTQARVAGGVTPTANVYYAWEARFNVLLEAELSF